MRRDGRFEPLTVLAQMAALGGVLLGAAITWWRHERPAPQPPHRFYEPTVVESPWRHP